MFHVSPLEVAQTSVCVRFCEPALLLKLVNADFFNPIDSIMAHSQTEVCATYSA